MKRIITKLKFWFNYNIMFWKLICVKEWFFYDCIPGVKQAGSYKIRHLITRKEYPYKQMYDALTQVGIYRTFNMSEDIIHQEQMKVLHRLEKEARKRYETNKI